MSSSTNTGGEGSQNPSGGRSTGAGGGPAGKFPCRNYQQAGHPPNYWVDVYGATCASCQVSNQMSHDSQPAKDYISVHRVINTARHVKSRELSIMSLDRAPYHVLSIAIRGLLGRFHSLRRRCGAEPYGSSYVKRSKWPMKPLLSCTTALTVGEDRFDFTCTT
jgi:hypothetical protein